MSEPRRTALRAVHELLCTAGRAVRGRPLWVGACRLERRRETLQKLTERTADISHMLTMLSVCLRMRCVFD